MIEKYLQECSLNDLIALWARTMKRQHFARTGREHLEWCRRQDMVMDYTMSRFTPQQANRAVRRAANTVREFGFEEV